DPVPHRTRFAFVLHLGLDHRQTTLVVGHPPTMAERRPFVMGRYVIDPAHSRSHVEVRVRFGETDLMGIVHHASYLSYFEAARVAWLRRRGVTYKTWADRGWHLPVVDAHLRYRAPAKFEDVLTVAVELSEIRSHSLRFSYRV